MKLIWIKPKRWWKWPTFKLVDDLEIGNHTIPAAFISNGANIPFFLLFILSPMGIWARAAFLHDYLLATHPGNRKYCAKEFRKALTGEDVPPWMIPWFYRFVRLWDCYRKLF